jgi:hypothetical protein
MGLIFESEELNRIKSIYYSKGILTEDSIWGVLAKKALSWSSKNADEIAILFKTSEVALAKSIDDIVNAGIKSKNIAPLDDIQKKLMYFFNPSDSPELTGQAVQKTKNMLNGYAKSKGKPSWQSFRDEASGVTPKPQGQAQPKPNDDNVQVRQNPIGGIFGNKFSGNRISNQSFVDTINDIDSTKITNWGGSLASYNKVIARAIKTGDYQYVSNGGFEKFGILKFRDFLKNNIAAVNEVIPETGRWSVTFK